MCGRVLVADGTIGTPPDDLAVFHDERANGNVAGCRGGDRKADRLAQTEIGETKIGVRPNFPDSSIESSLDSVNGV